MSEKVVCIYFNFRELMATFKKIQPNFLSHVNLINSVDSSNTVLYILALSCTSCCIESQPKTEIE